jgi:aminoglycoside phosphotransferase (APT) family kinase protein
VPTPTRQLCALLDDGHVLTDDSGRLPAFETERRLWGLVPRAAAAGDDMAVLVAPQLQVQTDPVVLLSVFAPRGERAPGRWVPIGQLAEDAAVIDALLEVDAVARGGAKAPPRRPDWFRTTWYDEVEAWVDRVLTDGRRRTGPARARKVWSMSAVVEAPCDSGPVWLKASAAHFQAEPALTRLVSGLAPEHAPRVIATDPERGWLLTENIPGADEDAAPTGVGPQTARAAVAIQLRSLEQRAAVDATGVPLRDLGRTAAALDEILDDGIELGQLTSAELADARAARRDAHALLERLASVGVPDTLVHGDLHTGNVAYDEGSLVLYDWSDACVSHPFLDAVQLGLRLPDDERAATERAFADAWRTSYPGLDTRLALELAVKANTLFQLVTFEQIYRAQEAASYWEMRGVVARWLRELPSLLT